MHPHSLADWQHPHDFALINAQGERRTLYVLILTALTMVVEIAAGSLFGSMALLADGWHMGTHVAAFLIAILAYRFARLHARDPAYAFGTGKAGVLGGFASAVALGVVGLLMVAESLHRLLVPATILFDEAIAIALLGLAVNLASAWMLRDATTIRARERAAIISLTTVATKNLMPRIRHMVRIMVTNMAFKKVMITPIPRTIT